MSDTTCPNGPKFSTPMTRRNSISPHPSVKVCSSEMSDPLPRSRKRKRRQSVLIDQSNYDIDLESASVQKWAPEEAVRTLRLVKDKFPEHSFALDTATGQIRVQHLDPADDGDDTTSGSVLMPSVYTLCKAFPMVSSAISRVTGARWSDADDRTLAEAYTRGIERVCIHKYFFPLRTLPAIRQRIRFLKARDFSLRIRRYLFKVARVPWNDADDEALMSANKRGLGLEIIQSQFFPQLTLKAVRARLSFLKAKTRALPVSTNAPGAVVGRSGDPWSNTADELLKHARNQALEIEEIEQLFPQRSRRSLRTRLRILRDRDLYAKTKDRSQADWSTDGLETPKMAALSSIHESKPPRDQKCTLLASEGKCPKRIDGYYAKTVASAQTETALGIGVTTTASELPSMSTAKVTSTAQDVFGVGSGSQRSLAGAMAVSDSTEGVAATATPISCKATGSRWSTSEEQVLLQAHAQGKPVKNIQENHFPHRTQIAVSERLHLLGLLEAEYRTTVTSRYRENSRSASEEGKQVQAASSPAKGSWSAADERALVDARFLGWTVDLIQKQLFPERTFYAVSKRLQVLRERIGKEVVKSLSQGAEAKPSVSANVKLDLSDSLIDSDSSGASSTAGSEVEMADSSEDENLSELEKDKTDGGMQNVEEDSLEEDKTDDGVQNEKQVSTEEQVNIPENDIEMEDIEESGNSHGKDTTTHDNKTGGHGHSTNVEIDENCPIM